MNTVEEEPALDLRNTLCSLLEAAYIAAMGTCQDEKHYVKEWKTAFGDAMFDISGANKETGIEGNFNHTRHVREYVRDEKVQLRGGALLERLGTAIWYGDGQGGNILVGRNYETLRAFLDSQFTRAKTINEALTFAQVDLALQADTHQAESQVVLRVIQRHVKGDDCFTLAWRTPSTLQMRIPKGVGGDLKMKLGRAHALPSPGGRLHRRDGDVSSRSERVH
jgi:hypothetical protein